METTRWTQVREVLEEALELAGDERARFLDRRCGSDPDLREHVERLLAQEERAAAWEPPDRERLDVALADPKLGQRIGPYRIESRLGSGGMGTVYRARRVDVDFDQEVALKLIKRGMDTDEVLHRFRIERDVLAALRHPYIALLLDAGASEDGSPWIAMELVDGEPIDRWCDARGLDVRERVELFIEVCRAVQHAHQHLIVHRDLKPSNILVTDSAVPKLLDFGIATLLEARPEGSSRATHAPQRPLTPEYASPEQVRGEATTTATDVYSLGVLLHLLLTGVLPEQQRADASAPESRERPRTLTGDLATIVRTTLAADLQQRYASVDALAADARRFLDGLPIQARRTSALYVARKFVARHRVSVGATVAVVAALVAGLVGSYASYLEAEKRRGETEQARTLAVQREALAAREAARANAVLDLVNRMLASASPHRIRERDYTLRQLLDDFDANLRSGDALAPEVELSIRVTMGRAYREIGVLDRARAHLERARAIEAARDPTQSPPSFKLLNEWVELLHDEGNYTAAEAASAEFVGRSDASAIEHAVALTTRGDVLSHLGRFDEAEPVLRQGLELERSVRGAKGRAFAHARTMLADMLTQAERWPEAEAEERAALAVWLTVEPQGPGAATALSNLANVLLRRGKLEEAEADYRRALAIDNAIHGPDHPDIAITLDGLGAVLTTRGAYEEAEAVLREGLDIARGKLGRDHPASATLVLHLAELMEKLGRDAEAVELSREGLRVHIAMRGEHDTITARELGNLGGLLQKRGQLDEAEPLLRRAIQIWRELGVEPQPSCLQNLGTLLNKRGKLDEAIALQREALELLRCAPRDQELEIAVALNNLAGMLYHAGEAEESERSLRESLEIRARVLGDDHPDVARSQANLALIEYDRGELADAEELLRRALATERAVLGDSHPETGRSAARLADVLVAQERIDEAIEALRVAVPALRAALGEKSDEARNAARLLDDLVERSAAER